MASTGWSDRIDETFDPSKAIDRSIMFYKTQIIKCQLHRFELTDVWKDSQINNAMEFGILTNEMYKAWSGIKASEYKEYKGIK